MWTVTSTLILFNLLLREELYSSLMFPLAWLHWDGYTGNKNLSRIRIVRLSNPETRKRLRGQNLFRIRFLIACGALGFQLHMYVTFHRDSLLQCTCLNSRLTKNKASLKNNEYYDDPLFPRKKIQTMNKVMVPKEVSLEQFLEIIAKADILIKAPDPDIYDLSKAVS